MTCQYVLLHSKFYYNICQFCPAQVHDSEDPESHENRERKTPSCMERYCSLDKSQQMMQVKRYKNSPSYFAVVSLVRCIFLCTELIHITFNNIIPCALNLSKSFYTSLHSWVLGSLQNRFLSLVTHLERLHDERHVSQSSVKLLSLKEELGPLVSPLVLFLSCEKPH